MVLSMNFSAQNIDTKAKSIMDVVTQNYKSKKNIYFKFTYGTGNGKVITKKETGIFYSSKDKYKLKIMGTEQISDGVKIYSISAEDQEVTISKRNEDDKAFSPLSYLDEYKNGYNIEYTGKSKLNKINTDHIKLSPTKNNGIKEVNIFVNYPAKRIVKIEQVSTDNSVSVITISEYKENQNLSSSMFVFDKNKYKDYLITEL